MIRLKSPQGSHAGFTLIELTMVILLLGIIGMFSSRFISSNVVLYQTSINQNERLNDARFIFNRLDKELNSAVAFSLRINTTGNYSCIDFVPFTAAGLYIGNVSGLSKMSLIMDRRTRENTGSYANDFSGQYVSVLTTNADDFYSLPSSTVAEITNYVPVPGANPTQADLTFGSNLSRDSLVSRYFIAENKVQYCLLAIGDSMRLFRNQAPLSAQNYTLDNRVLMADELSVDSAMNLTSASQFSHAILNLNFGFKLRDDSVLRFDHQLVISNVP
ncbi:prepilin-type N-terminal cleavage/methylation domain-containing protein [Moritella sp. 36]|uniref:prepilin-type N-terminal cleavage/methylation domain-containing protein n=1 Tax=Moritella sp. 36 TaxID=2746233 RepID=UPI001BACB42E|nr:prepilin-type N-terminal cleavage/methylation domain-containing protein [Moritella sp. 36]QUM87514.1 prepilin-type N-terminal cleavage/methylation domain-containing protein [Moritella sp. 36]